MKLPPAINRIGLPCLLTGGLAATIWFGYRQWPKDPYRNLKEEGAHTVAGEKAVGAYRWAGQTPTAQELKAAFQKLDEDLKRNPYDPLALSTKVHLGLEFAPNVAAAACERILQRSPNNYFALVHASRAYLALTNLNRALYYAAKAAQVQDGPEALSLMGDIFYAEGKTNRAVERYQKSLAMKPDDEVALSRLKELKVRH